MSLCVCRRASAFRNDEIFFFAFSDRLASGWKVQWAFRANIEYERKKKKKKENEEN